MTTPNFSVEFKAAMRRLTSTVCVVTCGHDGEWYGMTATAVTSVCAEPAAILVCINGSAAIYQPLLDSARFCVNMLSVEQHAISSAFGGRLRGRERFSEGEWLPTADGIPTLVGAQANLFATVAKVVPYGTHGIVIGDIEDVLVQEKIAPLLYQNGGYARSELINSL